jgi:hypothetical protein
VEATLLKVDTNATAATPNVEHAAANKPHRLALDGRPLATRREIDVAEAIVCFDEAVVALDDLDCRLAFEHAEEVLPEGVLALVHSASRLSKVGSLGRRGGRSSFHVHCFGSLSGLKRRNRVLWRKRLPCTLS